VGQFFDGWTNTAITLLWGSALLMGVAMFLTRTVGEVRDAVAATRANPLSDAAQSRAITFGALCLLFIVCMVFAYLEYQAADMNWFYGWLAAGGGALGIAYLFYFPEFAHNAMPLGNARLATVEELMAARLLGSQPGEGIRIGLAQNGNKLEPIRYRGGAHLLTVAPSGSGKGRDTLIPALLEFSGSCVVIDPKGQLAAITKRRRAQLGPVYVLNPFNILTKELGEPHRFNPMSMLDPASDNLGADCDGIANNIVIEDEKNPHFSAAARLLISGIIMHLAESPLWPRETKNLAFMRDRIMKAPLIFAVEAKKNGASDLVLERLERFADPSAPTSKEVTDVLSTARTQVGFMSNAALTKSLAASDFDFRELKQRPMTIYVVLPGERLESHSKWFRLIVASALDALMRDVRGRVPVLLMLDEFGQLGKLTAISNAMGMARSFGYQLWPVLQDLAQLEADYGKKFRTFVSNAEIKQFFGTGDSFTADEVSKLFGETTIVMQGSSTSTSEDGKTSTSQNSSYHQRRLFLYDEIMRLEGDRFLLAARTHQGRVTLTKGFRAAYFDKDLCPEFQGLYDRDPYEYDDDDGEATNGRRANSNNNNGRHSTMSRAEALKIFGLQEGATAEEIKATYHRLVRRVHPDTGGSDYFTQQLNQARDVLLGL